MSDSNSVFAGFSIGGLLAVIKRSQDQLVNDVKQISSRASLVTPARFLLLQLRMSQMTQIYDSVSNLLSVCMSMINNSVRNQKAA